MDYASRTTPRACGPCKETECVMIIGEDDEDASEDSELAALTVLYYRLFKTKRDNDEGRCECSDMPLADETPPPVPPAKKSPVDCCAADDESWVERADMQVVQTTLLCRRPVEDDDTGGGGGGSAADADEGDVEHLTAKLPAAAFRSCEPGKPVPVNATLFGLDLEQWVSGAGPYVDGSRAGHRTGRDAGGDSPVTVVAYVGNTGLPADD